MTLNPTQLDALYNNRALVPDHASCFERWAALSKIALVACQHTLDVAYGDEPGEKLDVFPGDPNNAPVVVFIHGGYWRSLDKSDHSFVAPPFVAAGACVVIANYDLCPAVTIPDITLQMVRALAWVYRNISKHGGNPSRITVIGHSAGGHLAAMLLACQWKRHAPDLPDDLVTNALSISGLYELDSVMQTPFLKESLRLTPDQVLKASPAWLPPPGRGLLYAVAGGDESSEFLRHNRLIQQAWGNAVVPVCEALPGLNHFSILEALVQPTHALHHHALSLLKGV